MYITRHAEEPINMIAKMFGAVLVTGARQVGKTSLLKEFVGDINFVTLDDPIIQINAVNQSGTFFKDYPPPVLVDEVQYAPSLFPQIKMILDNSKKKGQFFLTGSQQFNMMKNVSESLAGRIGILSLHGLSLREIAGSGCRVPFIPTDEYFSERAKSTESIDYSELWNIIHRGSFPEIVANPSFDWRVFYAAYVKTYIERDVRALTQVGDELKFLQFLTVTASRTGQLLNLSSIAKDVGISQPTAERWLSVLVASNLAYILPPYHNNITKRAIRSPKLYFLDTGLAAYLTRWSTPDVLRSGAMAGAFFETFVIAEVIKSYANKGILDVPLYFYRSKDQQEVDLLIDESGHLYPIEIKKHADPSKSDIAAFSVLDKIPDKKRGPGGVICMYENLVTLKGNDKIIPINML